MSEQKLLSREELDVLFAFFQSHEAAAIRAHISALEAEVARLRGQRGSALRVLSALRRERDEARDE